MSCASVIGDGPAAAVVFGGEVRKRTEADRRLLDLGSRIAQGDEAKGRLRAELEQLRPVVRAEKPGLRPGDEQYGQVRSEVKDLSPCQ